MQPALGFLPTSWGPKPGSTLANAFELIKPDAIAFGETHGPTPWGNVLRGGNFGLTNTQTGVTRYFGTQFIRPAPPIGKIKGAITVVGTMGDGADQAGLGISYKMPTPWGDVLFFFNIRQDIATAQNLYKSLTEGQPIGLGSISVGATFGVVYSVSDGALELLKKAVAMPWIAGLATAAKAGADLTGTDAWLGGAWRATVRFDGGKIKSINISGLEVPIEKIADVFSEVLKKFRKTPPQVVEKKRPQGPPGFQNGGSAQIASKNADIAMAYGQSPWDVAFSTIKRNSRGALEIRGGTINVLNHGNRTIAVAEPLYELGVKYNVLALNERIRSNADAGRVIDRVLLKAKQEDQYQQTQGVRSNFYMQALTALMNPYELDFGSTPLKKAYQAYKTNPKNQAAINALRKAQGLPPLPSQRPEDDKVVRDIYAGKLRWKPDLQAKPAPQAPTKSPSFKFPWFG